MRDKFTVNAEDNAEISEKPIQNKNHPMNFPFVKKKHIPSLSISFNSNTHPLFKNNNKKENVK